MAKKSDKITDRILDVISHSDEPLETAEIVDTVKDTRIKILYRLNIMRGEGKIRGKQVGSGKGCWIWWLKNKSY